MAQGRNTLMDPPIEDLLDKVDSKFTLVALGSARARQVNSYYNSLGEGLGKVVPPQVASVSGKPVSIAFEEIAAGKATYTRFDPEEEAALAEAAAVEELVEIAEIAEVADLVELAADLAEVEELIEAGLDDDAAVEEVAELLVEVAEDLAEVAVLAEVAEELAEVAEVAEVAALTDTADVPDLADLALAEGLNEVAAEDAADRDLVGEAETELLDGGDGDPAAS